MFYVLCLCSLGWMVRATRGCTPNPTHIRRACSGALGACSGPVGLGPLLHACGTRAIGHRELILLPNDDIKSVVGLNDTHLLKKQLCYLPNSKYNGYTAQFKFKRHNVRHKWIASEFLASLGTSTVSNLFVYV